MRPSCGCRACDGSGKPLWRGVFRTRGISTALSRPGALSIRYWRDKQKREMDFVIPRERDACDAIECKWNADRFEPRNLQAFRTIYPKGKNFVVAPHLRESYTREVSGLSITFTPLNQMPS